MEKIDYNLINSYFNDVSLWLFKDKDIEKNFEIICRLNDKYYDHFKSRYSFFEKNLKKNHLSYMDVINEAKEILLTINPKYVNMLDELLINGKLDFSYEKQYHDSHVEFKKVDGEIVRKLININRDFFYNDICTLIHEFMHYISSVIIGFKNKIITEFISIYFETYAFEYIYNKYDFINDSIFYDRLLFTYRFTSKINKIEIPLLAYKNFGNLDENSYELIDKYILKYSKETYNFECDEIMKLIAEEQKDCSYEFIIGKDYYYFIATMLTFYARGKYDIKNIIDLMENVSKENNDDLSLLEILNKYNLFIEDDIFTLPFEEMDKFLNIIEDKNKQRVN